MVQWLGLWASTAGATGSIPDWRTKIYKPHGTVKKKKKMSKSHVACNPPQGF